MIIRKTTAEGNIDGTDFCCSSDRTDRYGDIVVPSGIDLKNFSRNNVALFNHRSDAPIGIWENMRVEGNELRGRLKLAPEGTSDRIDEIRKLVKAKVLKATSIGFLPVETEPITTNGNRTGGTKYLRSELVEISLVSVPANSDAVALAKSLKISAPTMRMVFKQAGELSLGERIRSLRRTIQKAKEREAKASTPQIRQTYLRSIAHLEKYERELAQRFSSNSTSAASKAARERAEKDFKARVQAVQAEVESIATDLYERVAAAGPWGSHARAQETIDAFTRASEQMEQDHRLERAVEPKHNWPDKTPTWHGVKLPGPKWRGKKT